VATLVEVVALAAGQIPEAAALLGRAFAADPFMGYLLPDPVRRAAGLPALLGADVAYCQRHGACYTTTGAVRGVVAWSAPGAGGTAEEWEAAGFAAAVAALGDAGVARLLPMSEWLSSVRLRAMPGPHWYLMTLGVEPALQGQGIGGQLLQPILARAAAERLPCYLETVTAHDVRFYTK
jgi:hypothetical protein